MKNALFYITVFLLVCVSGVLSYYIFANTYRTDAPLFNFQASNYKYENVSAVFLENTYKTSSRFVPAEEKASSYGRGADLGKVLSEAVGIIQGPNENQFYVLDIDYFLNTIQLPYKIGTVDSVFVDKNNYLRNCENNTYDFQFDRTALEKDIQAGATAINLDNYLKNPEVKKLINLCDEYNLQKVRTSNILLTYFTKLDKYFGYSVVTKEFEISDIDSIKNAINQLGKDFYKQAVDPVYEEVNNDIYLLSYYENGYQIDVDKTLINLQNFLAGSNTGFNVETTTVTPAILSSNKKIYDFSNEISKGQTRMELIRNGFTNWVIQFADFGLYEVNNHIILPGEEFSFLNTISPNNGYTKSGFPIDGGICNSTTTIFRAALEAGLPITDRSYHYRNVPSYDWPYQMNIVDSAYYTNPVVDLKFVNDTGYPILMKFEKSQKDGFQYNSLKLMTSKNFQKRKVELVNWKKWNEFTATNFEASFDRIVYENNKITRQDYFYSRYFD